MYKYFHLPEFGDRGPHVVTNIGMQNGHYNEPKTHKWAEKKTVKK